MTARVDALVRVIEQTHDWNDCAKHGAARDHCHCKLAVRTIREGAPLTCRHCGARA